MLRHDGAERVRAASEPEPDAEGRTGLRGTDTESEIVLGSALGLRPRWEIGNSVLILHVACLCALRETVMEEEGAIALCSANATPPLCHCCRRTAQPLLQELAARILMAFSLYETLTPELAKPKALEALLDLLDDACEPDALASLPPAPLAIPTTVLHAPSPPDPNPSTLPSGALRGEHGTFTTEPTTSSADSPNTTLAVAIGTATTGTASSASLSSLGTEAPQLEPASHCLSPSGATHTALSACLSLLSQLSNIASARALLVQRSLPAILRANSCAVSGIGEKAGWILCLLVSDSEPAAALLAHPHALAALVAHGQRLSKQSKEEAAWALATLSAESKQARTLASHIPVIELLVSLVAISSKSVSLQAVWALTNLSLLPSARPILVQHEVMPCLLHKIGALRQPETTPRRSEKSSNAHSDSEGGAEVREEDGGGEEESSAESSAAIMRQAMRALAALLNDQNARQELMQMPGAAVGLLRAAVAASSTAAEVGSSAADLADISLRALSHACMWPHSAAPALLQEASLVSLLKHAVQRGTRVLHRDAHEGTSTPSVGGRGSGSAGVGSKPHSKSGSERRRALSMFEEAAAAIAHVAHAASNEMDEGLRVQYEECVLSELTQTVVTLLSSSSTTAQLHAATCVQHMAEMLGAKSLILEAGALPALTLVHQTTPSVEARAAAQQALDAVSVPLRAAFARFLLCLPSLRP